MYTCVDCVSRVSVSSVLRESGNKGTKKYGRREIVTPPAPPPLPPLYQVAQRRSMTATYQKPHVVFIDKLSK